MKCETGNARDYTNAKGKQLLTYLQSENKNYGPVFVVSRSREEINLQENLGNTYRGEKKAVTGWTRPDGRSELLPGRK